MPDVTCLEEKELFRSEPWGELLITVLLLLVGRAGLKLDECQLSGPSTSQRTLCPTLQKSNMGKESKEKRKKN